MDNWDPRKFDYEDKQFNSYDRGPGKNIPKDRDKTAGTELYITGIPQDLSNDGLGNLFSRSGTVLRANVAQSKKPNAKGTFGFVTMENLMQAEDAIRQLNNFKMGEYMLRVKIAMTAEQKEERKQKQMEDEAFLNSLPSSRSNYSKMKGSDSDSDRGSLKSGRPRTPLVNGNTPNGSPYHQQGKLHDRPGLLGDYPGQFVFMTGSGVNPVPSLMYLPTGNASMNDRFRELEQIELEKQLGGGQYGGGRGRGVGRGMPFDNRPGQGYYQGPRQNFGYGRGNAYNNHRYEHYGRGQPFEDRYGGGYNRPVQGYGRGYTYGQPDVAYGDNRNMGYGSYGRGRPNHRGDYQNYMAEPGYDGYNGHGNYEDPYMYREPFNSTPHYRGRQQMHGYGRGRNLNESRATSMESLAGPRKERKKVKVEARPCNVCSQTGSFQCSRCKTPYCSEKCQRDDWDRHKHLCKELSNASNKASDFEKTFEEQFEINVGDDVTERIVKQVEKSTGETVTCKSKPESGDHQRKPKESPCKQPSPNNRGDNRQRKSQPSPKSSDESKKTSKPYSQRNVRTSPKMQGSVSQRQKQESPKTVSPKAKQESPKPSPTQVPQRQPIEYTELPINTETEVMVSSLSTPDHIAVELLDVELMTEKFDLLSRMNERYATATEVVETPQVGMVYAAQYSADNGWYRARVENIDRNSINVTFIDYGNQETVSIDKLKPLKQDMYSLKAQAIICSLDGISPTENTWSSSAINKLKTLLALTAENQMFYKVTGVSKSNNVYKVKIKDSSGADVAQTLVKDGLAVSQASPAVSLSLPAAPAAASGLPLMSSDLASLSSRFSVGDKVQVLVTAKESPTLFYVQILDADLITKLGTLSEELNKEYGRSSTVPYRPSIVGEIAVAKFKSDGNWYRAEILSISGDGAKCSFVDYGNFDFNPFETIQKASALCKSVPKIAIKMKLFGITEKQTWPQSTIEIFDQMISPVSERLVEVEVKLTNGEIVEVDFVDDKGQSVSNLFQHTAISKDVTKAKPDSAVMASSVPFETIPMDGSQIEAIMVSPAFDLNKLYLQIAVAENIQLIAQIGKQINSFCGASSDIYRPVKGELVCALFNEDKLWYRAEVLEVNGDNYKVQFIDYGNTSDTTSAGIRKILPSLIAIPRQAVCCALKGVDLSILTAEQLEVVRTSLVDTIFKVQAHENKNDVYTATFFGQLDATNINNLIMACSSGSSAKILASSLSMESIPVDGSKVKALITESLDMKYIYVQIVMEKNRLHLENLVIQLEKYCQTKSDSYVPAKGELVCALFAEDSHWYRAEVLEIEGDHFTVFFVDYGNKAVVKSSSIRKINSSLATLPKQSVCCYMVGVDLSNLPDAKIIEFSEKAMNSQCITLQGVEQKDGYYDVILFSPQGENINELLTGKTSQPTVQPPSSEKSEVFMSKDLPMLNLPLDGTKVALKLVQITDNENLYFKHDDQGTENILTAQVCSSCQKNMTPYAPVKGELVCALYDADKTWYRAEVLDIQGPDYILNFVDFGNTESVKYEDIRKIDKSLTTVPKLAALCHLKGLDLKSLSEEDMIKLLTPVTTGPIQIQAVEKLETLYKVVLFTSDGVNINQQFMSNGTSQEPVPKGDNVVMACSLTMKPLPLDGSKVDVIITDATMLDKIYLQCHGPENQQCQADLLVAINNYCLANAMPYKPIKGELVCGLFEEVWYRAEVLQVNGDMYKLLYVDYGNTADVGSDLICKIDKSLMSVPIQAICCTISEVDLKSLSAEELTAFANIAMNDIVVQVQALKHIDRHYEVKMVTSNGICINDKFSKSPAANNDSLQSVILTSNIPRISLPISDQPVDAVITEVTDDCIFNLQANVRMTMEKLNAILGPVHQYCSTNTTPYKPVKGELVCAQFSTDKVWYRANVEDIRDGKYCVQYVDFGNREVVTETVIRRMEPSLATHPIQTVTCCLHDVPPSERVKTVLCSLKEVEVHIKVIKKENELYHVVICSDNINVNEHLVMGASATSEEKQTKPTPPAQKNLNIDDVEKTTPTAEDLCVVITHVVSPTEMYCQLADCDAVERLASLMQNMMCRCEIEDPDQTFRPQVGDLVCASYQSDGGWYRACVMEVYKNNTYLVQYCDFGNSDIRNHDHLRSMVPDDIKMPLLALKCSLPDVAPCGSSWSVAAVERVNQHKDKPLTCHVKKVEGDIYIMDLIDETEPPNITNIAEVLVSEGHAKRSTGEADEAALIQKQIEMLQAQLQAAKLGKK